MTGPGRSLPPFGLLALALYAAGLLSIGLTRDWRLLHEDNGALHTTLALSHLELGLARTRGHDLFYDPRSGEGTVYGHHPPGTALLVAACFELTGSQEPWAARLAPIACEVGSVLVLVAMLASFLPAQAALLGGLVMATLPMGAYFGRMVNYEPPCLFGVILALAGWTALRRAGGSRRGLVLLACGIVLGGLVDWASFFFAAAIAGVELIEALRDRAGALRRAAWVTGLAAAMALLDLSHLAYAGRGSLAALGGVLGRDLTGRDLPVDPLDFLLGQIEVYRRYHTHAGLAASALVVFALARPRTALAARLLPPDAATLRPLLAVLTLAPAAYLLSAPSWAMAHAYWQFYFLPFAALSVVLAGRAAWTWTRKRRRRLGAALLGLLVLDLVASSAYTLHYRHTRPEGYAIRQTALFRERYLRPGVSGRDRPASPAP